MDRITDLDPSTNPDAMEAHKNKWSVFMVCLLPLSSGRVAVFDRGFDLHGLIDGGTPVFIEELNALGKEIQHKIYVKFKTSESRFYGEPDDKQYAKDLRTERKQPKRPRKPSEDFSLAVDVEIEI